MAVVDFSVGGVDGFEEWVVLGVGGGVYGCVEMN